MTMFSEWKNHIVALSVILLGVLLRIWFGSDFEFKYDQMVAVQAGNAHGWDFLTIAHGMTSSAGVANPPGFYQILTIVGFFGSSPEYFSAFFVLVSVLTLPLFLLLREELGETLFYPAWMLTATAPLLLYLNGNIWAQTLLVPLSIPLLFFLTAFVRGRGEKYFIGAVWTALLMGSIHMSGLFLLPVLAAVWFKRRYSWRTLVWNALGVAIFFGHYLVVMLPRFAAQYQRSAQKFAPDDFLNSLLHATGGVAWYLFQGEAVRLTGLSTSAYFSGPVLYGCAGIGGVLFLMGCIRAWRERRILPPMVWAAVVLCLGLGGIYLLTFLQMRYFYWLGVFVPGCVVAGYGALWIKPLRWRHSLVAAAVAVNLCAATLLLDYLARSGGHVHEYGLSYARHQMVLNVLKNTPKDWPLRIHIRVPGEKTAKLEPKVLIFIYGKWLKQSGAERALHLVIAWRDDRYVLSLWDGKNGKIGDF